MILEGMHAYRRYMSLKLHFTTQYDFFKYGGKSRAISEKTFAKRKDVFFFRKIERKYSDNDEDLTNFFVSNFISSGKTWVGDLTSLSAEKIFADWKKNNESMTYLFTEDLKFLKDFEEDSQKLFEVVEGGHPQLLKLMLGEKIRIETVVATNRVLGFMNNWDEQINEKFIYPNISKLIYKYDPFVKLIKTKNLRMIMRTELL